MIYNEHQMRSPLGHVFRDIKKAVVEDRYYMRLTLSCGHETSISKGGFSKHHSNVYNPGCTLCVKCTIIKEKGEEKEKEKE